MFVTKDASGALRFRAGSVSASPTLADDECEFICSTASPDTYGDVIIQSGISLADFKRNPVLLFAHDPTRPIGRAIHVGLNSAGNLSARFKFATAAQGELGAFAESVCRMIKGGFLAACSIGFMAIESEPRPGGKGRKFTRTVLKEISIVSIPANSDALIAARHLHIPERHAKAMMLSRDARPTGNLAEYQRRAALRARALQRLR